MNKPKLSIIILSWNTKDLLKQCVESIVRDLTTFRVEIIIVDNGSTDGSVEYLRQLTEKGNKSGQNDKLVSPLTLNKITLKLIENKENLGFAKGNNQGIKEARGEYIMLLNSDTIVKGGAIEKLVEYLDKNPNIDIVGPKLLNKDGSVQANCGRFPNLFVCFVMLFKEHFGGSDFVRCSPKESKEVDWLMGAAFMARRKVFEKIGGLDEDIFMYMEEVEWFYRSKKAGFTSYFYKDAEIIHLGRGSSKSGKKEPILNIYKGLLHFYKKHKSLPELLILNIMLKIKAFMAFCLGFLNKNNYLKETYGKALKIN